MPLFASSVRGEWKWAKMRLARPAGGRLLPALLAGGLTVLSDQCAKWAALHFLSPGQPVSLIGQILRLNLIYNPGIAFGLPVRGALYFALLAIFLVLALAVLLPRSADSQGCAASRPSAGRSALLATAVGLGLGGAASNLADRFRLGAVIDFIDLGFWPVFNIADIALTLAAALLAVNLIFGGKKRAKAEG